MMPKRKPAPDPWRVASPEPWTVVTETGKPHRVEDGSLSIQTGHVGAPGHRVIARVMFQGDPHSFPIHAPDPEGLANAHMMAAAARMLAALKLLEPQLKTFLRLGLIRQRGRIAVLEAIDKAEGRKAFY